jgi:hypothetical protein
MIRDIDFYRKTVNKTIARYRNLVMMSETIICTKEKHYFEDTDDLPSPNDFKTFHFIEWNSYVSSDEFETFNFNYVLRKTIDVK